MNRLEMIAASNPGSWAEVLGGMAGYDFYHLPQYHSLAEQRGEGEGRLFHYTEGVYSIALPLLLRPLSEHLTLGLASNRRWYDATSVYGYAGPVCSHSVLPEGVMYNFRTALQTALREMDVVSVFSRLHPFLSQAEVLEGLGECREMSRTVSIDLTVPKDLQRAAYRSSSRRAINNALRRGVTCVHDQEGRYLREFAAIYEESMRRVSANEYYLFSQEYFEKLWLGLGPRLHLFVCLENDRPICASLITACQGIVQYHLGGTRTDALAGSPISLLLDEARQWASDQGHLVFHLGGGVGARSDSLFQFKTNFSKVTHPFRVWRWVVMPEVYERICTRRFVLGKQKWISHADGFFPAYRGPIVPRVEAELGQAVLS